MQGSSLSTDGRIGVLADAEDSLREAERFHMGIGKVHKTLAAIARSLQEEGIEYVIVGGMAVNAHGFKRETVDVDLLVTPEGLEQFRAVLVGKGYRPAFEGARKRFRDTQTGVKVEFLTTGEFPGDGKPKPVAFPNPVDVAVLHEGKKYISLPELITLKLACAMTNPDRLRDFGDVQELIRYRRLTAETAQNLHPYVREKFLELVRVTKPLPPDEDQP